MTASLPLSQDGLEGIQTEIRHRSDFNGVSGILLVRTNHLTEPSRADSRTNDGIGVLANEIIPALKRIDLSLFLAWTDTRTRYRRSILGPFWLVLGTTIGVGGLGFVWSQLFDMEAATFVPSLTIGLVCWYLLSQSVVEAASVFVHNREMLLNMRTPSLQIALQLLLRHLVTFAHNLVVVVAVLAIYPTNLSLQGLLAIPGLLLVCISLLGIILFVGFFGARFRDLEPLLNAVIQPLFFITPVIFRPEQLGNSSLILALNPFAYWLSLIRDPLMGTTPPLSTWLISAGMAILIWAAALTMVARKRQRLAYWVH